MATDRRVEQFTESVSFDRRLFAQDIAGSTAHALMLAKVGLITADECRLIEQTLGEIRREIEQGSFPFQTELEDIHMHVEKALTDRLGDVGRKLHTARSRNDQVSTDLRLWVRDAIDEVRQAAVGRARGVGWPLRCRCRCGPARLYPHAACPAGAGPALLAGLLREVRSAIGSGWPIAAGGPTA